MDVFSKSIQVNVVTVCVDTCEVIDTKDTRRMRFIHDNPINHTEIKEPIDLDKSTILCCPSKVVFNNPSVPRRIYIDVTVDGVPVRALADTGAERICIGGDVLEKINELRRRTGKQSKVVVSNLEKLTGINGHSKSPPPMATIVEITWNECTSYERALIINEFRGLILSVDYLRFTSPIIDWARRSAFTLRKGIFRSDELLPEPGVKIHNI